MASTWYINFSFHCLVSKKGYWDQSATENSTNAEPFYIPWEIKSMRVINYVVLIDILLTIKFEKILDNVFLSEAYCGDDTGIKYTQTEQQN